MGIFYSKFFIDAITPIRLNKVGGMLERCKSLGLSDSSFNYWIKGKNINYTLIEERDCWSLQVSDNGMTDYYKIDDGKLHYDYSYKADDEKSIDFLESEYYKTYHKVGLAYKQKQFIPIPELHKLLGITDQHNSNLKVTIQLTSEHNAYLKYISELDNTTIKETINRIIEEDLLKRYDELKSTKSDI